MFTCVRYNIADNNISVHITPNYNCIDDFPDA